MQKQNEKPNPETHPDHAANFVTIKVNGVEIRIKRGGQTGIELKTAASCPSTHVLKLLPEMTEIANEARINIKGGEEFVCHPRMGQAS